MIRAVCTLESISPLSFSRHYTTPEKTAKESAKDYELRTWRERCHYDPKTKDLFIPPMMVKNALAEAAKFLSMKIVGKGQATYTKHFEAGTLVLEGIPLGVKLDDVAHEDLFLPSDGKRGGTKRVDKRMPLIAAWKGEVTVYVLDATITEDVFEKHMKECGNFIGYGRFRPRNNGIYGRFKLVKLKWIVED